MELNMTQGSPFKLIMKFMLPVFLGNLFNQLYNIIDTVIVGRYLGVDALAAVGATGSIIFLVFGFMNGMTTGFTIPIAQLYGEGNTKEMKKYIGNTIILSALVTIILTVVSVAGMDQLLKAMNVPQDIFEMSKEYIIIICGGMVCCILYGLLASILRAVGNSKAPLYFLVIAVIANIVFDYAFIVWFDFGVAGAALATILAQLLSGLLCVVYMLKKTEIFQMPKENFKLNMGRSKRQVFLGIPMALQFSVTALGSILTQAALNTFGTVMVASYIVAGKIEQIVTQPFSALGMTMATYCAQNWGKYDLERVRKGCRIATLLAIVYSAIIFCVANPLVPYLVPLFISENVEVVIGYAGTYVLICSAFFIPLAMIEIYRNALQGCGEALVPLFGGVLELAARAAAAYLAVRYNSYIGVCFANASAWFATGVFLVISYLIIMSKKKSTSNTF